MSRSYKYKLAILAAAFLAAASVSAQRASLSERVESLEARLAAQQDTQAQIEILNRLSVLQQELLAQRGLIEELQNDNASLRQRLRELGIDFDSRLARLEAGQQAPPTPVPTDPAAAMPAPAATDPATAARVDPGLPATPGDIVAAVAQGPMAPATAGAVLTERALYDSAFQALRDGDYAEASRRFQAYLEAHPTGALAPNAWYWLGESYYVTQNYAVALQAFQSLLEAFPGSDKAPDALLKLGFSQFELGRAAEGEATLREVAARFPGSEAARLAQSRLRSLALDAR